MFGKKGPAGTIDSLIGAGAIVEGELRFKGGLRIDGEVRGNVIGEPGAPSLLVLSEQGRVVGSVQASQLVVNGSIEGPVQADVLIELQPKARVTGSVRYKALEMHPGAVVEGVLAHFDGLESERPSLKLASSKD